MKNKHEADNESPSEQPSPSSEPKIYSIKRKDGGWLLGRRSFLEVTAAATVGALGASLSKAAENQQGQGKSASDSNGSQTVYAHEKSVKCLAISPDGKLLVSGGEEGKIKLWALPNGAFQQVLSDCGAAVDSLVFAEGGKSLLSGSRKSRKNIVLWSLPEAKEKSAFGVEPKGDLPLSLDVPLGQNILASGGRDNVLRLWELPDGRTLNALRISSDARPLKVLFLPDGKTLASLDGSGRIAFRSVEDLVTQRTLPTSDVDLPGFLCFAVSANGETMFAGRKNAVIEIISVTKGLVTQSLRGHSDGVNCLAVSSDGSILASGSDDTTIKLWSLPDGALKATLSGHVKKINAVAISPDGKLLASGSDDRTIRLWSLPQGKQLLCLLDLETSYNTTQGVQYKSVNQYGQTITYTLPCGSPIPAGAVCVCNCVPGSLTMPANHTQSFSSTGVCTCDLVCTCNTVCTCQAVGSPGGSGGGYGGHYWYPN